MSPTSESTNWYYAQDGESIGPVTFATLITMLNSGELASDTPVIEEGKTEWQSLDSIRENLSETSELSVANSTPKLPKLERLKPRIRKRKDANLDNSGCNPLTFAGVVIIGSLLALSPLWVPLLLGLLVAIFMWAYALVSMFLDMFK